MLRYGLDILHPRERRPPRMPNSTSPLIEQRVLASSLAHPTGSRRISDELGGPSGAGCGSRHGLNTKAKRLGLVAGYAAPAEPIVRAPEPERHIDVDHPGELIQMDCFDRSSLRGQGNVLAIHRHRRRLRLHLGGSCYLTPRNPSARWRTACRGTRV